MLILYYSPGACSLAPHIALEKTGASYALQLVSIPKGEQQVPEYRNVNPRGKIPALRTDEGVLTGASGKLNEVFRIADRL
jgi:glutathione S-transferase